MGENKLKIQLMIEQGAPKPDPRERHYLEQKQSLCERVDEAIDNIQSNMDDIFDRARKEDWCFLRCLFRILSKKSRLTASQYDILEKIEPVIRKHAFYGEGAADIDGMDLNKTKGAGYAQDS